MRAAAAVALLLTEPFGLIMSRVGYCALGINSPPALVLELAIGRFVDVLST